MGKFVNVCECAIGLSLPILQFPNGMRFTIGLFIVQTASAAVRSDRYGPKLIEAVLVRLDPERNWFDRNIE